MTTPAFTAVFALVSVFATRSPAQDDSPFADIKFDAALARAEVEKKVVMVDFFTTWCGPCKKLDATTWKDPDVVAWLGQKTIALKLDAEVEVELAKRFSIASYPTMLFVRPDGTEVDRIVGYREPAAFLADAKSGLAGKGAVARAREKVDLAAGTDPMARGQLARELASRREYAEALEHYLWCWDHGLEHSQSYVGVRGSFLLSAMARLAEQYAPAREAMVERRDVLERRVLAGELEFRVVADFTAMSKNMGEQERLLSVYDEVKKKFGAKLDARAADRLFKEVCDLLIEQRRYADVVKAVGDPLERLDREMAQCRSMQALIAEPTASAFMQKRVVTSGARYFEACLGVKDKEAAISVADAILEFAPSVESFVELIGHAERAGDEVTAHEIAERGLGTVPEEDQAKIRAAIRAARRSAEETEKKK